MIFISAMVNRNLEEMNGGTGRISETRRKLSILIYAIGAIVGMVLIGLSIYADFEASLFDVPITTGETIRPVSCPVFMDMEESGIVQAAYKNQSDEMDNILVEVHISHGESVWIQEEENQIQLEGGAKQRFSWEIFPSDATDRQLILTKMVVTGSLGATTYKGSCGVMVVNLPGGLSGTQFFWLLFSIATLCLWGGIGMWLRYRRSNSGPGREATGALIGLGILIQAGVILVASGYWELAAFSFYVVLLLFGVIIPHFFVNRKKA